MNRYIINGIIGDLAAGRSVLVLSPTLDQSNHAARQVFGMLAADGVLGGYVWAREQWIRDERTEVAVTFLSVNSAAVGHAAGDVVVINGYREMVDHANSDKTLSVAGRLGKITAGREAVVID